MATYVRQHEVSHPIGPSGRLTIKVTDGDLRLRGTDGSQASLRIAYEISAASEADADRIALEYAPLEVAEGDGWLEIRERQDRTGVGAAVRHIIAGLDAIRGITIEGEAPAGCELSLDTVSGDMVVAGMRGEQRYTTVSGDLVGTNLEHRLRLTTVSGDATVRGRDRLAIWASTVSGDVSVMAPVLADVRLNAVSGDLELEGALARDGSFRAESVSGDLSIGLLGSTSLEVRGISTDVHVEMDHRLEGRMDRRRVIIGDGTPTFVFSSMSGDVLVRRPRRLEVPVPPPSPVTPAAPTAPAPDASTREAAALEVLRALERGEIDVEEASRRLATGSTDA